MAQLLDETHPEPGRTTAAAVESGAATETAVLSLAGLWCASCGWLIAERLRRAPGVIAADVSFGQGQARVVYDPTRTDPRRCAAVVRRLGYRAWLPGERPYDEEEALFIRLLIGGLFVMHDMVLGGMVYGREWLGWATDETAWLVHIFQWMMLLGAIPVAAVLGLPILRAGLASLLRGRPNTHALIALGASAALVVSVRNLLVGSTRTYFDTASMLFFLVSLGHWLDLRARKRGNDAVTRLRDRLPAMATWLTAAGAWQVPAGEVLPGARVAVAPGEPFPVDGVVVAGEGDVDESLLTGEPVPVLRRAGERVLAGTTSMDGAFEMVTTAAGESTAAGQLGRLLHAALWERAPVERLADRLAALMVPLAVALAAATFAYWTLAAGAERALLNALCVLLIACPCALGLATPLTLWSALGRAAAAGAVPRGAAALERLAAVRRVCFDKTGTLTVRPLRLAGIEVDGIGPDGVEASQGSYGSAAGTDRSAQGPEIDAAAAAATAAEGRSLVLARAAAVEAPSGHPLGEAIVAAARSSGVAVPGVADWHAIPGRGVRGTIDGLDVLVGSADLMAAQRASWPPRLAAAAAVWRTAGHTVLCAAWSGRVRGVFALEERMRPEVPSVVADLAAAGLPAAVLTGDDTAAGERWRARLGVETHAALTPDGKLTRLRAMGGGPAAMVGDGINDGPALAAAAVGIALRHGTDVARAAADVVLLRDDLRLVPWLLRLAQAARRTVRQNLLWAFAYNLVGLGLAVSGRLQPSLAALAMVASSAMVTTNALRLRRYPLPSPSPDGDRA